MSLQQKFRGTGIAIITPFLEDGTIDWDCLKKLVHFWIENTVEYLVVLGTTGESATIHGNEKQQLFSFVSKEAAGKITLVAGIGGNDTYEVLKGFKEFDLSGYDAILSVAPYYNKPGQQGIYQHYRMLDAATPLPIIMYNVPGRTGQNITAETTLRIAADCPNIFATKEASGNLEQINYIIKHKPETFMVISGDDNATLPMIACGAQGLISVVANAFPKDYAQMVRYCLTGNFDEARILHLKYLEIVQSLFEEGSPAGVKAYMTLMGLCKNAFRMPVVPVSETLFAKIESHMASLS